MKGNTGTMIVGSSYHVLGQISRPKTSKELPSAQTSKECSLPNYWSHL